MRRDQLRDRDSIRRDCITAEIDDLEATCTFGELGQTVTLSISEPQKGEHGQEPPKFQLKLSALAFTKLRDSLNETFDAIRGQWHSAPSSESADRAVGNNE